MIDPSTCETCGHLAVLRECEHASDRVTPCPLDFAVATTAATLALVVVLAGSQSWLGAWAYFVAVALAAWTPSWLVAPIAIAGSWCRSSPRRSRSPASAPHSRRSRSSASPSS
jgi:hypothetical protein